MKENYKTNYSINRVFDYDVYRGRTLVWEAADKDTDKQGTIASVRRTMQQKQYIIQEAYTCCEKGELFDQNLFDKKVELL